MCINVGFVVILVAIAGVLGACGGALWGLRREQAALDLAREASDGWGATIRDLREALSALRGASAALAAQEETP